MQRLKLETRESHDRIEKLAYVDKIMAGTISLAEYKNLIAKNYVFHLIVEHAIEKSLAQHELDMLQFEKRKKASSIYTELKELGMANHELSEMLSLFGSGMAINSMEEALGAMYVMEGATLGGAIIKRELGKAPQIAQHTSFQYYGCYGDMIGAYWMQFKTIMDATVLSDSAADAVVAKAIETFRLFESMLQIDLGKAQAA